MIRIIVLAFAFFAGPVHSAALLVTGTVTRFDLSETGVGEFAVGQAFSLVYQYAPGAIDVASDGHIGDYRNSISDSSLSIGGYSLSSQGGNINVVDDGFGSTFDRYSLLIAAWNATLLSPSVSGLFPYAIEVQLDDPTGNALTSDSLPAGPWDATQFVDRTFILAFASSITPDVAFGVKRVYGHVDSISFIPEPSTLLLFGVALVMCVMQVKRRRSV